METQDDVDTPVTMSLESDEAGLVAAIKANAFPGLQQAQRDEPPAPTAAALMPHRLGRFAVLREVGRGGMGVVYACYDEQLERKVAVKLLRSRVEDLPARKRLEREGQALARLSHPNVVQIYELGEHHGSPFVAMEFVVGETLREWLSSRAPADPRQRWREVAALLRQAGAGLEAAHAASLVHRDFKPDNVIVGADGRLRVLDFGLVGYAPSLAELPTKDGSDPSASTLDHGDPALAATGAIGLTRTGTVMGTPAYMAPEQHAGEPCDAASDQFSFCVTAFEALFGQRPFGGRNLAQLRAAVRTGEMAPLPASSPVPRHLQAAILRGLALAPGDRWPDMSSLLAEFERALGGSERRVKTLVAGFGLTALLAGAAALANSTEPELCQFDASALTGVWDGERRTALREAYAARKLPFADESVARLDDALSDWGERWLEGQRRNCEATRVTGSQSEALLDLRASCLERQRREVAAITATLTEPEGTGLSQAFELLAQLPDVERCADPGLGEGPHPLPSDPTQREAILAAYEELSEARALLTLGRIEPGEAALGRVDARLSDLDYLPLTLEFGLAEAQLELARGQLESVLSSLREVVREAEIASLSELAATARTRLAFTIVGQWGDTQNQAAVLDEAEIAVARVGRAGDPRELSLAHARAAWLADSGDLEGARGHYETLAASARERGETTSFAHAQQRLGRTLMELDRHDEAEDAYARAEAAFIDAEGPGSLGRVRVVLDRAYLAIARGEFEDARSLLAQLRTEHGSLLEPGSDLAAMIDLAEAKLALMRGEFDQAEASFRRVAESQLATVQRGEAWQGVGAMRFYANDIQGSLDAYERARVEFERTLGPDHPTMGLLEGNIGEAYAAKGDHQAALAAYASGLAKLEPALPPDHIDIAFSCKGRGESHLALGHIDAARRDLERALAALEHNPGEPLIRAQSEFSLAQVLLQDGERERALGLARRARASFVSLHHPSLAQPIDAWLQLHDPDETQD